MKVEELEPLVVQHTVDLSEIRHQVADLVAKEKRVQPALRSLRARVLAWLGAFHRDRYKSTDQRLQIGALAEEIRVFDKLGYDVGVNGAFFALGVGALLEGRNQSALDHFAEFIRVAEPTDPHLQDAHYLSAMIYYNRRDFNRSIEHFNASFRASPKENSDWQSKIYVGELLHFLRAPSDQIEKTFRDVEEALKSGEETASRRFLRATLYIKWANCYVGTLDLEPKQKNHMTNNALAITHYKRARTALPKHVEPDSLLPVVIDYSLAQALLLGRSIDMDLAMTPLELLADAFHRLRRIVLTKREEIILAQCYLMLGTCGVYSPVVSADACEIYLEYARTQTLSVPSDVCFYSCISKELLNRDEFVSQIDFYASQLQVRQVVRRR